jgi:hypothetical protein
VKSQRSPETPYREADASAIAIAERDEARSEAARLTRHLERVERELETVMRERDSALDRTLGTTRLAVSGLTVVIALTVILMLLVKVGFALFTEEGSPLLAAGWFAAIAVVIAVLRRLVGRTWRW